MTGAAPVVVVNTGSSSVKLRVVERDGDVSLRVDLGPVTAAGVDAELEAELGAVGQVGVVGHRIVHGGDRFAASVVARTTPASGPTRRSDWPGSASPSIRCATTVRRATR